MAQDNTLRKGVILHASRTRKLSQPRSKDSKARQAGSMQSDLQRIVVEPCAVEGGARWRVTRNVRKRQGSKRGRLTWNRARLEHCVDGGGRPRILDQPRRLPKFGGRVVLRG